MIFNTSSTVKTARANVWLAALSGGKVEFYSDIVSSNGGTPAGNMLASANLPAVAGSVASGAFSLATGVEAMATVSGSVGFARFYNAANSWLFDVDCGLAGGGAGMILDVLSLQVGGKVIITAFVMNEP